MKLIFITLIQIFLLSSSNIELYLLRPLVYHSLNTQNLTIEDLEYTHFLTKLRGGSPTQRIPLEIKMSSDEILILNNNNEDDKVHILSNEISKTFEIIKDNNINKIPAVDKFIINKKAIDLKFKSIEKVQSENINSKSSGILGLSLGDIDDKKNNKFIEQLFQNNLIKESIFYYELFPKYSDNKLLTLQNYLSIRGKLIIGQYPYDITKENKYILKSTPVLQRLNTELKNDQIYYSILINVLVVHNVLKPVQQYQVKIY